MANQLLYNISFDIAGLAIITAVLIVHVFTYRFNSPNNKRFRLFLYMSFVNGATSIITSFTISYAQYVPDELNMLLNIIYQISACLTAYFGLRYILTCFNIDRKLDRYIDLFAAIAYAAILVANLFFNIMFSFQDHVYVRGPLYQTPYLVQAYFLLHGGTVMVVHRKEFLPRQLILNMSYVVVPLITGAVQIAFPHVLLTYFGGAVAALFMIFSLETSDYVRLQKTLHDLDEARAEAMEANQAKSEFLARMSHEIRTPINGILGMNSMILKSETSKEVQEYSVAIDSAGKSLLSIVNKILDLSKVESGKFELNEDNYQLSALVNKCYDIISRPAEEKGLYLIVEIDPSLPSYLYGDSSLIQQVVVNLLNNAVKYTEKGGVHLTVSGARPQGGAEGRIDLSFHVSDTGIGIKPQQREHLFDEYARMGDAVSKNIEGTGLGLAIVMHFIELLGGSIHVESEYGEGSVFAVTVPQRIVEDTSVGVIELETIQRPEEVLYAPDAHVLVVDDVELNLKVAAGYLQESGMTVDLASSGEECLNAVKRNRYDIIFTDHMMPGMDGVETFRRMHAPEYVLNAKTPVVMMTANAIHGARDEYMGEGFADYLSKPLTQSQLLHCIAKHIDPALYQWMTLEAYKVQIAGEEPHIEEVLGEDSVMDSWIAKLDYLNVTAALPFCGDNLDFYLELVGDFVAESKMDDLTRCYEAQDWRSYEVHVHALKSSSKLIGAIELSELAFIQELAAKQQDPVSLHNGHDACMREYAELLKKLERSLES